MRHDEQNQGLEEKLEQVHEKKKSFSDLPPFHKPKLMQRIGKKRTYWYIEPFGTAQNAYNEAAADALTALGAQIRVLQRKLDALSQQTGQEFSALRQEQRQLIGRNAAEQSAALRQLSAETDRSFSAASPESRTQAGKSPLTELSVIGTEALFREFHDVRQAEGEDATEEALKKLEDSYERYLREQLEHQRTSDGYRPIAVICRQCGSAESTDPVSTEARAIFRLLQRASRYPAYLLFVEPAGGQIRQEGDVCMVPENRLGDWMNRQEPALLILCEKTPELLTAGNNSLLLRNAIVRLCGENPAQGLGGSRMQELLHLNDYGLHRYYTASRQAADLLEELGFRRPAVMYPYLNPESTSFRRSPRAFQPEAFTAGVVFLPEEQQTDAGGIAVLCDTVLQNPDIRFLILWQNGNPVPEQLTNAKNCEIRTGEQDMSAFYSDIDCVLVPYTDQNSACPHFVPEAMLMNIPAVVPPASGLSEPVSDCGLGIVAEGTDAAAFGKALQTVRTKYAAFGEAWRQEKLRAVLSAKGFVHDAEACIAASVPQPVHTLYEWNRQLKLRSQHLIKGNAPLKAYFQRLNPADGGADAPVYPQNCFDLMERSSVRTLLRHFLGESSGLRLLDIQDRTGSLLGTLLPFGSCTAYDASPAVLRKLREKYPESEVALREADLLTDGIEGSFDVITVFRYLRHFEYGTRKKLFAILRRALSPNGMLLFDVPNRRFELPHRAKTGWDQYPLYDIFWTKESIAEELAANGLKLKALVPVGQGLYPLPAEYRSEPVTWTACAAALN